MATAVAGTEAGSSREGAIRVPPRYRLLAVVTALAVSATVLAVVALRRNAASDELPAFGQLTGGEPGAGAWGAVVAPITASTLRIESVAAAPGAVVVTGADSVAALEPMRGDLLWQRTLALPGWAVAVAGDLVVTRETRKGGGVELRGIDATSGTTRWVRRDLVDPEPVVAGEDIVLLREQADGADPALQRLDDSTGATVWEAPLAGELVGATVVGDIVVAQTVTIDAADDGGTQQQIAVNAHDLGNGEARWTLATAPAAGEGIPPAVPPVAAGPEAVVVSDAVGRVFALDVTTGRERWRDAGPRRGAGLAVVGDVALYSVRGNEVRAVGLSDGGIRWETGAIGVRALTALVGDGAGVAVLDLDGEALVLDARNGDELVRMDVSGPTAFHSGTLVVGSSRGEVTALEPSTGVSLWTTSVPPRGTAWLAADSGQVYVTVPDPTTIVAFEARTGDVAWRRRILGRGVSAPTPDGSDRLVVRMALDVGGPQAVTLALRSASGQIAWAKLGRERAVPGGPLRPAAVTPAVIIDESAGTVRGLDSRTGEPRWSLGVGGSDNEVTAVVGGERLAFASTANGGLVAIEPSDGSVTWEVSLPSPALWVISSAETAVVAGEDATIRAVDGAVRWEVQLPRVASHPPLVIGDTVIVNDGRLVGMARASGRIRWELPIRQPLVGPPVAVGESVAVATRDGSVHVVAAATGRTLRQHLVSGRVLAGPVVCGAQLCVLTDDGRLRPVD
ncbi:MAG: PQQ-binding-like beta-propeller repeat protein [Nitriliruptorales bacterium]